MYKILKITNYISIILSVGYFSLCIRVVSRYGCQYAVKFSDPDEMGMDLHYFLHRYFLTLNLAIFIPVSILLLIISSVKKKGIHIDSYILYLFNAITFIYFVFNPIGPMEWLAD